MAPRHLLQQLYLPDRYEGLVGHLGPEVVRVLVPPPTGMEQAFITIAQAVDSKRRGVLIPAWGRSGTGKSTLSNSLHHWLGAYFTPSVAHTKAVDDEALEQTMRRAFAELTPNDERAIPVVIDGREGEPASDPELAALKRFVRTDSGRRAVVLWLETSEERAENIGRGYQDIAGEAPIDLPVQVEGPDRDTWAGIARSTLELSNQVGDLEALGVDPSNYDAEAFETVGDYLSQIAEDFNATTRKILTELAKPTQLVIAFASETRDMGPIAQMTEGRRLGLLNAHALVGATPGTEVGRWWADRMGVLTSSIVRLSARAYVMPPTLTVTALRRSGDDDVKEFLRKIDVGDADPVPYWQRSDIGRFLIGNERDAPETRGNPSEGKTTAFRRLGEKGFFSSGRDRSLNRGLGRSLAIYLAAQGHGDVEVVSETQLATPVNDQGDVIPDLLVNEPGMRTGIEITWRQGDWVTTTNRAAIAEYILRKLRGYAMALGWAA